MSYFLDFSTIAWIVGLIAVAFIVYGFVEAEREVKLHWKELDKAFGTKLYGKDSFDDSSRSATGLLEMNDAAIGVNVRIVAEGILIRGVKSTLILIPWSVVRRSSLQSKSDGKLAILVRMGNQREVEMTLPWLAGFPIVDKVGDAKS